MDLFITLKLVWGLYSPSSVIWTFIYLVLSAAYYQASHRLVQQGPDEIQTLCGQAECTKLDRLSWQEGLTCQHGLCNSLKKFARSMACLLYKKNSSSLPNPPLLISI